MSNEPSDEQEAASRRIDMYLDYLKRSTPSSDGRGRKHQLGLLLSLCRAYAHGRMTLEQKQRHRGVLRKFARLVRELQRSGDYVPPLILDDVEKAQP